VTSVISCSSRVSSSSFSYLPSPHLCSPLFPYTTLFRSHLLERRDAAVGTRLPIAHGSVNSVRAPAGGRHRRSRAGARTLLTLPRSEEHTSELQSLRHLVCRLLLEKKKQKKKNTYNKHTI